MRHYVCPACGWKGGQEEVDFAHAHEILGVAEDEVAEEDNEVTEVCPKCRPVEMLQYDYR